MSDSRNDKLTCGVDIGARSIDIVVLKGKRPVGSLVVDTGPHPPQATEGAYARVLAAAGLSRSDLARTVATGYGRNHFKLADATVSEIVCHAVGVAHLFPTAETIVDIGGQDSKAIRIAPGGRVLDFAMNDRCAAGTGRFIEMVALTLGVSVEEAGSLALKDRETREISSMCAVFAESEIIGLLQSGAAPETILRGVFRSVARRTMSLLAGIGAQGELVFTGGVAKSPGAVQALRDEALKNLSSAVLVPPDPQTTGALGAAIIAQRDA